MIVAGGGKGVVLDCETPIMVKWKDGTMIVLSEDKSVILYDPHKERLRAGQQYLQDILDAEARRGL